MFTKMRSILKGPAKKALNLFLSFALLVTMLLPAVPAKLAVAAAGDTPEHAKLLQDNGDGTYKLLLSITGDAERIPTNANVIVVFDTSSSMNTSTGSSGYTPTNSTSTGLYGLIDGEYVPLERRGNQWNRTFWYNDVQYTGQRYSYQANTSRLVAAENAVNVLAESLLDNNTTENPETIEIAFIDFANTAVIAQQPTTDLAAFEAVVNSRSAGNNNRGTNWEAGLAAALDVDFNDEDTTYVIFVSDGNPTFRTSANGYTSDYNNTYGVYGSGAEQTENINRSYNAAVDDAQALVNAGYELYTIGVYGNVDRMEGLTTDAGAPAANYYSAANTAALQAALAEILEKIEMAGIADAEFTDPTTSQVEISGQPNMEMLEIDTTSFKYYRAGGTNDDGSVKYNPSANTFTPVGGSAQNIGVEWTSADDPTPPDATVDEETGMVDWDLSSIGILENGVTYTVTFDVYPSQETYDLIADLKNGKTDYDSLPEEVRKYLVKTGENSYSLKTNKESPVIYWDDTRDDEGRQSIEVTNPEPVVTDASAMQVQKIWIGTYYGEEKEPLDMQILRDGTLMTDTIHLDTTNGYKNSLYIATGLLRTKSDGTIQVLDEGHDYKLLEPEALSYHWELEAPTKHPMIINGTRTMLIEAEDQSVLTEDNTYTTSGGKTYYRFGGKTYVVDDEDDALTATNTRRSNLNLKKVVVGDAAPEDAEFTFSIKVITPPTYYDPQGEEVWFSVRDADNNTVKDLEVTGATPEEGDTGYFHCANASTFTVKMKADWNLRFTNLLTGTTFEITETDLPENFRLQEEGITIAPEETEEDDQAVIDEDSKKISGTIIQGNETYQVTYTNEYVLADVVIEKTFSGIGESQIPADFAITATYGNTSKTLKITDEDVEKAESGLKYTWKITGLPLDTVVSVSESGTTIDGYSLTTTMDPESGSVTLENPDIYTITLNNTYEQQWGDNIVNKPVFTIQKVDQDNEALAGVVFTLKNGDTVVWTGSTGSDGTVEANFNAYEFPENDPAEETVEFTLTETAPEGYTGAGPWTITVAEDDGVVKVELNAGKTFFQKIWDWIIKTFTGENPDSFTWTGSTLILNVKNTIKKYDVTVNKTFSGITEDLIPEEFAITAVYGETSKTLKVTDKDVAKDGLKYTWTLEDVPYNTEITFTETGYEIPGYTWTEAETEGTVTVSTDETKNVIDFTNAYTKETDTKRVDGQVTLTKVDQDGNTLDGAVFSLTGKDAENNDINLTVNAGEAVIGTGSGEGIDVSLKTYLPDLADGESLTLSLTLTETTAPTGYKKITTTYPVVAVGEGVEALDEDSNKYVTTTTYTITIDGEASLTVENEKITGKDRVDADITVSKVDQDGNALAGATFSLTGTGSDEKSYNQTFTAGEAVISTSKDEGDVKLALPDLAAGESFSLVLTMKEEEAPTGYDKDTAEYTITISGSAEEKLTDGVFVTTTTYTIKTTSTGPIVNTKITGEAREDGTITLKKLDEEGQVLAGATFTLSGEDFETKTITAGEQTIGTGTDGDVPLNLPALTAGESTTLNLVLKETNPPTGYKLDETEHKVVITGSAVEELDEEENKYITTTTYTITVDGKDTLEVKNEKVTDTDRVDASIEIKKVDQDGNALDGATFTLSGEGITTQTFTAGTATIGTGASGNDVNLALPLLAKGTSKTYTLTLEETTPPDGYEGSSDKLTVTVKGEAVEALDTENGKFITTTTYTITVSSTDPVVNTKITGTDRVDNEITIKKVDQDGNELAGAEFTLSGEGISKTFTAGTTKITTGESSDSAYVALGLADLKAGESKTVTLTLKETKAPAGYKEDGTEHTVTITGSAEEALDKEQNKFITTTTYTITVDGSDTLTIKNEKDTGTDRVDGTIEIEKQDQDEQPLEGATFTLSGEDINETFTAGKAVIGTGSEGDVALNLPDLADGETKNLTLTLKETIAPDGYELDSTEYTVTITGTGTEALDTDQNKFITTTTYTIEISKTGAVINTKIIGEDREDGEITIKKVDDNGEALDGAEFTLTGNGINKTFTAGTATISTGKDGDVALDLDALKDGESVTLTLKLKESKAPAGYAPDDTEHTVTIKGSAVEELDKEKNAFITTTTYTITVDGGDSLEVTNTKKTETEREDAQITIKKVDQDGEALDGAEFTLTGDDINETFTAGEAVIGTGEDGDVALELPDLADGETYEAELTLKESKAPGGYDADETEYKVVIKGEGVEVLDGDKDAFVTTTTYTITVSGGDELEVENPKRTDTDRGDGEITIRKVDENGELLEGATFQLTGEDIDVTFTAGEVVIGTGENGDIALNLPELAAGETKEYTLTLKETEAPSGYVKDDTEYIVTIKAEAEETLDTTTNTFITTTYYTITVNGGDSIEIVNPEMITPPTGDDHHMMVWYLMAMLALAGLSGCGVYLFKGRRFAKG